MASKLGNPDVVTTGLIMEVLDILLEVLEAYIVPMNADEIGLLVDKWEPVFDPLQTTRSRSGRRRSETVTLVAERSDILIPDVTTGIDIHEGLRGLVDSARKNQDRAREIVRKTWTHSLGPKTTSA